MIVTCEECTTSFQLDEARIPPGGARVRCSRCKHAFFLPNPGSSQTEAVHSIAEAAVADPAPGVPAASADVADDAWSGLEQGSGEAFSADADVQASASSPVEPPVFDEEEDWQFSEEVRVEGDDLDDEGDVGLEVGSSDAVEITRSALDFDCQQDLSPDLDEAPFGEVGRDASGALATNGEADLFGTASALGTASGLGTDADGLGVLDDFSAWMQDDVDAMPPAGDPGTSLDPVASLGESTAGGLNGELDDPESWDLVGHESPAVLPQEWTADAPSHEEDTAFDASRDASAAAGEPTEIDLGATPLMKGPLGRLARFVGGSLTLSASLLVAWFAVQAEWARLAPAPQEVVVGPLEARAEKPVWVETARSGPLLRIRGVVTNVTDSPLSSSEMQVALLDAAGSPLVGGAIPVGLPLPEAVLREASPAQISAQRTEAIDRFASVPLSPGENRPFEAIVTEAALPDGASRVVIEGLGSH